MNKFTEECAVVGIWNHEEAANMAYLSLYAMQHRGQEGAGVISLDNSENPKFHIHKGLGVVSDVFDNFDFSKLKGRSSIGHVRYTTAGGHKLINVQPFYVNISRGPVAIAHNGSLVNTIELKRNLIADGAIFSATSDTEVVLHLLARAPKKLDLPEAIFHTLKQLKGAFSIVLLFKDRMFAIRDPHGFRPLCLGQVDGAYVVVSETCALDLVGAKYIREIQAGEVLEISDAGLKSYFPFEKVQESPCIFEYVYFSRPDSIIFNKSVYAVRKNMGAELCREAPAPNADIVIPIPDSGVPAAIGFAQAAGIPFEYGLIRNHYVGRTFIEPKQSIRDFGVKIKLNPNSNVLKDKSVVVVDDSIVRGTTSRKLIKLIRAAGAREVHMRISSPPTTDPCYYGVDTPSREKLIAATMDVKAIREYIGADSLAYLSLAGMYIAANAPLGSMCDACFSGKYPVEPTEANYTAQELFEDIA